MKRSGPFALLAASFLSVALCAQQTAPPLPRLMHRPPPRQSSAVTPEGSVHLDVVVDNAAGKPVTGLWPWNFKLLDNGQPAKILSFRGFNSTNVKPVPPVRVLILLDTVNMDFSQVAFMRGQLAAFLRADGGHLALPTSLIELTDAGVRLQPRATLDGNALAESLKNLGPDVRTFDSATAGNGAVERFQNSVRQLEALAYNMANVPGRKLLIWLGYGWFVLEGPHATFTGKDQQRYFQAIVALTNELRKARMVLYSVNPAYSSILYTEAYRAYLNPVTSMRQADSGNLALKVLVMQTGGKITGPNNDIAGQIRQCLADADTFYTISFNPPPAAHPDEYHSIELQVDRPGLLVRTNSGYYNEPKVP